MNEGHRYERAACKYCSAQISTNALARHELKCQDRTPEERERVNYQRDWQQRLKPLPEKPRHYKQPRPSMDNGIVPVPAPKQLARPMSISMLVEEDTVALALGRLVIQRLPELLPQLIPGLSIEAFVAKHVRGPNKGKGK